MNVSAHLIETILCRWSDRTLIESPNSSLSFSRFFEKASLLSEKLETEPGDRVFLRSKDQESLMVLCGLCGCGNPLRFRLTLRFLKTEFGH